MLMKWGGHYSKRLPKQGLIKITHNELTTKTDAEYWTRSVDVERLRESI